MAGGPPKRVSKVPLPVELVVMLVAISDRPGAVNRFCSLHNRPHMLQKDTSIQRPSRVVKNAVELAFESPSEQLRMDVDDI